jgi:hypothetical protein
MAKCSQIFPLLAIRFAGAALCSVLLKKKFRHFKETYHRNLETRTSLFALVLQIFPGKKTL